jgi:hypothetical protein
MTIPLRDQLILGFDRALRTLAGAAMSSRPVPGAELPSPELSPDEARHAAGLMRVNHTGEVCAQALYSAGDSSGSGNSAPGTGRDDVAVPASVRSARSKPRISWSGNEWVIGVDCKATALISRLGQPGFEPKKTGTRRCPFALLIAVACPKTPGHAVCPLRRSGRDP